MNPVPRKNKTKYIILGLLNNETQTGYKIRQAVEYGIHNFWPDISYGQIYPTLKQLESAQLVTKQTKIEANKPLRNEYTITDQGRDKLRIWLNQPADHEIYKLDVLLKLYFSAQQPLNATLDLLQDFKRRSEETLHQLKEYETQLRRILHESPDHFYILLTLLYGQTMMIAQLTWVDQATIYLKDHLQAK